MYKRQGYSDVLLLDPDGRILLAANDAPDPTDAATRQGIAAAFAGGGAAFSDFYRSPGNRVHLDAIAPVHDAERRPLAALVLRSDAASYLYPLIQSWPTSSRSGETLLVRREGDAVVYLNEPVSYTHLDVYKRQASPGCWSSAAACSSSGSRVPACTSGG